MHACMHPLHLPPQLHITVSCNARNPFSVAIHDPSLLPAALESKLKKPKPQPQALIRTQNPFTFTHHQTVLKHKRKEKNKLAQIISIPSSIRTTQSAKAPNPEKKTAQQVLYSSAQLSSALGTFPPFQKPIRICPSLREGAAQAAKGE